MSLISANFISATNWNLVNTANAPFASSTQSDSLNFTLQNMDFTIWNQIYVASLSILPAATTTIDLTSLTNLVAQTFSFGHVKCVYVLPSGAAVAFGPGASNGLVWFFDDATATVIIQNGGMFMFSDIGTKVTGQVVDGTHKTLKFVNQTALGTAWSSVVNYVIGDIVSVTGNNYTAIAPSLNHTPPNTTYWVVSGVATVDINIIGSTT